LPEFEEMTFGGLITFEDVFSFSFTFSLSSFTSLNSYTGELFFALFFKPSSQFLQFSQAQRSEHPIPL
jgi:hypothetical protein